MCLIRVKKLKLRKLNFCVCECACACALGAELGKLLYESNILRNYFYL